MKPNKHGLFTIGGLMIFGLVSLLIVFSVTFIILSMFGVSVIESTQEEESDTGGAYCEGGSVSKSKVDTVFEENAKGGGLEGKGDYIIKSAKKHKIDPQIFMAIIIHETGYGHSEAVKTHNNVAGMMGSGDLYKFDSIEEGIDAAAKNLYKLYFSKGLTTVDKIQKKYAPIGAANDPGDTNSNWKPTINKLVKNLNDGKASKAKCKSDGGKFKDNGKDYKGKIPSWSNSNPGKNNLYTAGQCTWYAYGIRQKMGKPVSTFWHDAHKWNERAKAEGYKVGNKPKKGAAWIAEQGAGGHSSVTGHVGIVIDVKSDNEFVVTEMNASGGPYKVSQRTVKMTDGYSFIY
ncbi:CHAP domain-containing protein [Staphylococcus warneri]|uniref:CHAP domain-containing protein n=1 Tax=Staphylococcus warneri TaxID=1292 RepID=UPI003260BB73